MIIGIDASRANHDEKTGVEWYAYHSIEECKVQSLEFGVDHPDVQFILYTDKPLQRTLAKLPPNWTQKVLKWPPRRLWTQMRLSIEMLLHPPDVLFIPAHVFPIIHPKKTVMTVHDVAALRFPQTYSWFERWYTLWSAKHAVKHLWKVIVPSECTKRELSMLGSHNPDRVVVIPHGYTENRDIQDKRDIDRVLGTYHIRPPFVLSVGRLEEKKNTRRIIEAFTLLKKNIPDISISSPISNLQLVLVGTAGFGYEKVKEAIVTSPYKNDIILPNWVKEDDLDIIRRSATVFVFPSLYEGFGLPVLESFAAGVPVVAGSGSSLEEVAGDAALFVNPLDTGEIATAMKRIIFDSELRERLIRKGAERLEAYRWSNTAKKTLNLLFVWE